MRSVFDELGKTSVPAMPKKKSSWLNPDKTGPHHQKMNFDLVKVAVSE
jgi:hypothetical protein